MDPPTYEEVATRADGKRVVQRLMIRDELGLSRRQHVRALVDGLLPRLRERATMGLARSPLLVLPSDQASLSKGELVGFPEEVVLVQLEGPIDSNAFWTQREAQDELRKLLYFELAGEMPAVPLEQRQPSSMRKPSRSSWFGRKASQTIDEIPIAAPHKPPVVVDVQLKDVHFRTANDYGLYETTRAQAVLVTVEFG